ncbi:restriction endonuclease subunit S [Ligilactobacillus salivarius]|uniref:restriction endonuclease subunit S n=1 Tax=Ligilactobacillus salivarius TaxID=1624 RepID=UPI003B02853B
MWEQQELGAVVEFYSGLTYKPENVVQNGTLVIRSSNIHNNQYINADNVYVKNNIVNSEYVQEQDIVVVVRNGSRNLIGKHALLKSIPHDPSVIGAFMTGIRSLNNQFIEAVLNTEKFKREINKNLGATINQITTSQFKKMKFNFPKREEDKQIGILFNYLDDTIQLHERKCEELTLIKKALLQKLFPKKDKDRPEVRYKNFSDAWEQRKLVSLFSKFTDGDWIESKDQANTGIRLIQTGNIGITEFINKFGNEKWISEETFKKLNCEEIFPGDIIISRLPDPAGRACILPKLDTRMITAVDCTIARTSRETSAEFIVQYLSTQTYFKYVQSCLAGGTRQRISRKNLANFNVSIPTEINEQKQIGFFFKQLDTLIALHQRKLEKLKQLKKFLLQNMFI